jgi:hypothetical protein
VVQCQQKIPDSGPSPSDVANVLQSGIPFDCAATFNDDSGDGTNETFNHGDLEIKITRSSINHKLTRCSESLRAILDQCVLGESDYGGIASFGIDEIYNITNINAPQNPLIFGLDQVQFLTLLLVPD